MSESLTWETVEDEIEPIAQDWIESVKETFENHGYDVSSVGETESNGGIGWDVAITNDDGETIAVTFEVVDSIEYEGEMLGYNVSIDAVHEDGRILGSHTPHNYTDKVWTTELSELKQRANEMPPLTPEDLN